MGLFYGTEGVRHKLKSRNSESPGTPSLRVQDRVSYIFFRVMLVYSMHIKTRLPVQVAPTGGLAGTSTQASRTPVHVPGTGTGVR